MNKKKSLILGGAKKCQKCGERIGGNLMSEIIHSKTCKKNKKRNPK
jgi:hypothetical protein